jgi:hypothetical protein
VSVARERRRTDTPVRAGASAVVSAHRSSKGGGAHSALQSRLGPDHHYVKLLKRCKKILAFTPRTAWGEQSYFLAYSCVFSRNGIAPYRELTFLVHRDNVKSVDETHRAYASRQLSYFLIMFIYEHKYNTSVVPLVNANVCAQSPVSAGAPVGQRTTSGGNTCADTPNPSFYGHFGDRSSPAALKSGNNVNTFGKLCQKCAMNWWTTLPASRRQ